ncbi:MAG: hypothetical protein ACLUGH_12570 [Oscillospiraceae bacterium]
MKKRILSILLLCCMVLTLLPTAAFAAGEIDEQFTLAPGGTYYFDLSAMGIPGTVNDALPDKTMRYKINCFCMTRFRRLHAVCFSLYLNLN